MLSSSSPSISARALQSSRLHLAKLSATSRPLASAVSARTLARSFPPPLSATRPSQLNNHLSSATTRSFATAAPKMAANDTGVHNLMSFEEYRTALGQPGVMVVDAFATWCGPCKMIAPQIVNYAKQYPNVRFYKVDVDEVPDVAQELGIRAMPTIKVFKDGEEFESVVGANPPAIEAAVVKATA